MCGLVGMITKNRNGFTTDNLNFFDHLLYLDALRGEDSTGVFVVDNIGNVQIAKHASASAEFLPMIGYRDLRTRAINRGWAMIGHNRKATRGVVNDANAHPFWIEDKLVLVHNGTVFGDHKKLADTEVDSEAVAQTIADHGDDVEGALKKIDAAYALIWYNVMKKEMNFIRNTQRPLSWMETPNCWYFASEGGMLEFVAARTNTVITSATAHQFDEYTLDTWTLNKDKSLSISSKKLDCAYVRAPSAGGTPSSAPFTAHPYMTLENGTEGFEPELMRMQRLAQEAELDCAYETPGVRDHEITVWPAVDNDALPVVELTPTGAAGDRAAAKRVAQLMDKMTLPKNVQVVRPHDNPKWEEAYTYREFLELRKSYPDQTRIKVELIDYSPEEAGPGKLMMTGMTADENHLYVVFPVAPEIVKAVTHPDFPHGKIMFQVEVDKLKWNRSPKQKGKDGDMNTWKGSLTLTGMNPKLHIVGSHQLQ